MMQHAEHLMGAASSLDAVLLVATGFAISLGHCLGMCGPLVGGLAGVQRSAGMKLGSLAGAHLVYHLGRVTSYAIIGMVFATAGSALGLSLHSRGLSGVLSIGVGLVMILLALGLLGWLPTRRWLESRRLAGAVMRFTAYLRRRHGGGTWFLLGAANGFLPCGPIYAVAVGTVSSRPLAGAAAMALFGLGTIPALLAFALGVARISPVTQRRFNRLAALLILLIGVQLMLRGMAALGWIDHLRVGSVVVY